MKSTTRLICCLLLISFSAQAARSDQSSPAGTLHAFVQAVNTLQLNRATAYVLSARPDPALTALERDLRKSNDRFDLQVSRVRVRVHNNHASLTCHAVSMNPTPVGAPESDLVLIRQNGIWKIIPPGRSALARGLRRNDALLLMIGGIAHPGILVEARERWKEQESTRHR